MSEKFLALEADPVTNSRDYGLLQTSVNKIWISKYEQIWSVIGHIFCWKVGPHASCSHRACKFRTRRTRSLPLKSRRPHLNCWPSLGRTLEFCSYVRAALPRRTSLPDLVDASNQNSGYGHAFPPSKPNSQTPSREAQYYQAKVKTDKIQLQPLISTLSSSPRCHTCIANETTLSGDSLLPKAPRPPRGPV